MPEGGTGAIYQRFFNRAACMVHRTTIGSDNGRKTIKVEVGYGNWADRATLEYEEAGNYPKYKEVVD